MTAKVGAFQNLPWVEKYRPKKLDDLISHEEIIRTINKFIDENQLPHLLLYGPPGTGKTSTILACARKLYTPAQFNSMVLEMNASDDRGIGIVRGQILSFASTGTMYRSGFKLIILDEADAMTNDAQNALRRIIEKYTDNVRFCILCNYLSKIIPALQSRCTKFRFGPLTESQILPRLDDIIKEENLNVTEDGKKALITLSGGDMRKVLNVLQSTWLAFNAVTEDNVYSCVGHPRPIDIKNIVNWLLNESYELCYCSILLLQIPVNAFEVIYSLIYRYIEIQDIKLKKGLALQDILTELHLFVNKIDFPESILIDLVIKLAEIEKRVAIGCSESVQLNALVSAFQNARDIET
ncbi:replication factor C subunit 5 isoform X1 [Hylaeus anthracinus]|uniref:replication factor C subunit 5 isoform X1 n=1 Tax=Hylaeus volcanicus TaxID=313075 RepID=UPI0023B84787|nr:replication factor C subunit 5 isoform X1 [Hylaeus volcanicus]XP_053982069.1 replication factor C subunit 5 isoform X1 [Hylaeus volcanicus]XP_053982070.1 replication factor C subunit 5 isoform X1 [Hylaeus volcanicus]XP_053997954.1 replication factor C subunit 5 isoform X1 [Hylaeus anthracinus]XP_053997955.1 replication factor C subunit 5 isoform X1 [Hylaeus anthracinus]XP_053997956.1 replication factor C subunit 5 isoform X1 [Hylaeus anthracinus]XP_053997957.1 replication factor C subunit 